MKIYISEKLSHLFESEKYEIYENNFNEINKINEIDKVNEEIIVLNIKDDVVFIDFFNNKFKSFYIDLLDSKWNYRNKEHLIFQELIVKALGIKKNEKVSVVDCYAGFGKDGFIMAMAGCEIISLEASPIIFILLQNAIKRLREKIPVNWNLYHINNMLYLKNIQKKPDIIYLDPMFPERNKAAKVKKEAQILQFLGIHDKVGDDILLMHALAKAQRRVIVKRPLHSLPLSQIVPSFEVKGKMIRYDIYLTKALG